MAQTEVLERVEKLDDVAFEAEVFKIIQREVGLQGLLRFLRVHGPHEGNFTEERRQWQENLTIDEILAGLPERKQTI